MEHQQPAAGAEHETSGQTFIMLRRQSETMVLCRGCPPPSTISVLKERQLAIGVALTADELEKADQLSDYAYAFVATSDQAEVLLKRALADLRHGNWSVEANSTWIAITTAAPLFQR